MQVAWVVPPGSVSQWAPRLEAGRWSPLALAVQPRIPVAAHQLPRAPCVVLLAIPEAAAHLTPRVWGGRMSPPASAGQSAIPVEGHQSPRAACAVAIRAGAHLVPLVPVVLPAFPEAFGLVASPAEGAQGASPAEDAQGASPAEDAGDGLELGRRAGWKASHADAVKEPA